MNRSFALLVALAALNVSACRSQEPLPFPKEVNVKSAEGLERIRGTRLFVKVPGSYRSMGKNMGYKKNDSTFFQVIDVPGANFSDFKNDTLMKKSDPHPAVVEEIRYNGFEGLYFERKLAIEGEKKTGGEKKGMALSFGYTNFFVSVVGVCPANDAVSEKEMKDIFTHFFYDTSFRVDPLEFVDFQIDRTLTGFRFAGSANGYSVYSTGGKGKIENAFEGSSYRLLPWMGNSFESMKRLLQDELEHLRQPEGVSLSNLKQQETVINGNRAIEITAEVVARGRKAVVYLAGLLPEGTGNTMLFTGIDMDNGRYFEKYKATVRSLQFPQQR